MSFEPVNSWTYGGTPERVRPTEAQRLASDPAWASENPAQAALNRWYTPWDLQGDMAFSAGAKARRYLENPDNSWRNLARKGVAPAGLMAGGVGALLGYGAGAGIDLFQGKKRPRLRQALAALMGIAGASLGGYAGYHHKEASQSALADIRAALTRDAAVSPTERVQLLESVTRLPSPEQRRLASMLEAMGGAGVAALIARFLLGAGRGGMLMAGAAGFGLTRARQNRDDRTGRSRDPNTTRLGTPMHHRSF